MTLSFITVIKLKFQDASTKVQESFFLKLKSQYRYQKLNYLNTLAVIPNQYLINRKGGRRKQEECKTAHSSPPDYETRNIVSTSDGVSCAENDEKE